MNALPPRNGPRPLAVGATAAMAWRLVFDSRDDLLRIAAVPMLITYVLSLALRAWQSDPVFFLVVILDWAPVTLFGVAWLRFLLLHGNAGHTGLTTQWTPRETKFFGRVLLINVGTGAAAGLSAGIVALVLGVSLENDGSLLLVAAVAGIVALYLVVRLSLVLPATAIDRTYGFRDSWRQTAGCHLQLLFAMLLANLPAGLALILLEATGLAQFAPYTFMLVTDAFGYVVFAASMAVLAVAFRASGGQPLSVVSG